MSMNSSMRKIWRRTNKVVSYRIILLHTVHRILYGMVSCHCITSFVSSYFFLYCIVLN